MWIVLNLVGTTNFKFYNFVDFDWFAAPLIMVSAYKDLFEKHRFNGVKTGQLVSNVSPITVSDPTVSGNTVSNYSICFTNAMRQESKMTATAYGRQSNLSIILNSISIH